MEHSSEDMRLVRDVLRVTHHIPKAAAMADAQRLSSDDVAGLLKAAKTLADDIDKRGAWIGGGGEVHEPADVPETDFGNIDETPKNTGD